MFDVLDGGIVETIEFSSDNLKDNKSIIVLDEESQTVWLWHGKLRGLVARRTALRQAQSLKGHGYQSGNSIVGRHLNKIEEIDSRKVGRVPEVTEINDRFLKLLDNSYRNIGNNVFTKGSGGSKPQKQPVASVPVKKEAPSVKKLETPVVKKLEPISVPKPKEPIKAETSSSIGLVQNQDLLKQAAVIVSVLDQYKDIWISRKENGSINIEQMDGKICNFKIEGGKISYEAGSFTEIPSEKRNAIETLINELL
jgi:hypothetical protein